MKKGALFIFSFLSVVLFAQEQQTETKSWTTKGILSLQLNQATFTNWSAGGVNSVATSALAKLFADYKGSKSTLNNSLTLKYGLLKNQNESVRKNEDLIDFNSQYNQRISEKWNASGLLNFSTQFANGYNYPDDSTVISRFFSPAYLTIAPGFTYKPADFFRVFLTPVSMRTIFVLDDTLAKYGAFGVDPGENIKLKMGAFAEFYLKKDVVTDLNFESRLNFFYNYLADDAVPEGKLPLDVHWQNFINYKLNRFFSTNFFIHLAYMPGDVRIEKHPNELPVAKPNDKLQVKQTFGIGFAYNF